MKNSERIQEIKDNNLPFDSGVIFYEKSISTDC